MGTRIHVYLSHNIEDTSEPAEVLARLKATLPQVCAVRDYWISTDPSQHVPLDSWTAHPPIPRLKNIRIFEGPGLLRLWTTSRAARISTGCRWRGFLSIPPLHAVHLAAFRAIARAMNSPKLAICSDGADDVTDLFLDNRAPEECIAQLQARYGSAQKSVDSVAPEIAAEAEARVPQVWYLDPAPPQ